MLELKVIAIGKLKERFLSEGCAEYQKRLGAFCRFTLHELPEARLSDHPSQAEIHKALDEEGEKILDKAKGSYLVALCIEGEMLSSVQLSEKLEWLAGTGKSSVSFAIGSSFGLSDRVKEAAGMRISMSRMTFPHQLARLMLLEQLYRACSISAGSKYHK